MKLRIKKLVSSNLNKNFIMPENKYNQNITSFRYPLYDKYFNSASEGVIFFRGIENNKVCSKRFENYNY